MAIRQSLNQCVHHCIAAIMLLTAFQAILSYHPIIEESSADSNWIMTTDTDFNNGVLDNVIVDGTGSDSSIQLSHLGSEPPSETTWYNTDWQYRSPVSISNTANPSSLLNYQIKLNILYDPGMKSDFSDLLFSKDDGISLIQFWIENHFTSTSADVWIEVPLILASSTTVIYMYFGNPSATSASDFDNTFTKDFAESGIAGLWHVDDGSGSTVSDISGYGNNGAIFGATWVGNDGGQWSDRSDISFSSGDCLNFDGNDYVDLGNKYSGDSFSVSAWIYVDFSYDISGAYPSIIGALNNPGTAGWNLYYVSSVDKWLLNCARTSDYIFAASATITNDQQLGKGRWQHITGVVDGNNGYLYIDGNLAGSDTGTGTYIGPTSDFRIGDNNDFSPDSGFFEGKIDEVRIYERALSAQEVLAQYERRKITSPEPTPTIGYPEGLYHTSGSFISPVFDFDGTRSNWYTLQWTKTQPSNTEITFQVRSGDTLAEITGNDFIGPGGSLAMFYDSSPAYIWSGHNGDRRIQYQVFLTTLDPINTPVVDDITINYNCLPDAPLQTDPPYDEWLSDNKPTFKWEFSDHDSTQQGFQVSIDDATSFSNPNYNSQEQDSTNEFWQFPKGTAYKEIEDGTWYWKVRTQDSDGDWSQYSDLGIIKIDTTPPESFKPVAEPSNWASDSQPVLIFSTTDETSGIDHYEVSIDDGPFSEQISPYTLPAQSDGIHMVTIRCYDLVSNYIDEEVNVYIDTANPDTFTPVAEPGTWSMNDQPVITFSTTDATSGIDHYEIKIDDTPFQTQVSPFTMPPQLDGVHILKIRAYDLAGNYKEEVISTYIDLSAPNAFTPTVDHSGWSANNRPTVTFSTTDNSSGIDHYEAKIDNGDFGPVTSPHYLSPLTDGAHMITLRAFDKAMNYRTAGIEVLIDTTPTNIVHVPVINGKEGEGIQIVATISDDNSGVGNVTAYIRKQGEFTYSGIIMEQSGDTFTASILGDTVTSDIEYYIEATDRSTPPTTIYYGKSGISNIKPTVDSDIDIAVEVTDKTNEEDVDKNDKGVETSMLWLMIVIILVVVALLVLYITKTKGTKAEKPGEFDENSIEPIQLRQTRGRISPPPPVAYQRPTTPSITHSPSQPQTGQPYGPQYSSIQPSLSQQPAVELLPPHTGHQQQPSYPGQQSLSPPPDERY